MMRKATHLECKTLIGKFRRPRAKIQEESQAESRVAAGRQSSQKGQVDQLLLSENKNTLGRALSSLWMLVVSWSQHSVLHPASILVLTDCMWPSVLWIHSSHINRHSHPLTSNPISLLDRDLPRRSVRHSRVFLVSFQRS